MLQTCNLSSFLQFLKIFRQIGPHLQIQPRSLGPRSEGNWAYRPMGFFDGIWSETFQHAKSCWMTFWQTKESSRIHGLYCIIKYHQLSSYEIWIHMNSYDVYIILLSQDIPNLWISPFEPLMPLYPSTTSKTWRLERGRRGGKTCCTDWHKKNTSIQFSKSCYILHMTYHMCCTTFLLAPYSERR